MLVKQVQNKNIFENLLDKEKMIIKLFYDFDD